MKSVSENIEVFFFKIRNKVMALRLSPLDTLVKSASNTTLNIIGKIQYILCAFPSFLYQDTKMSQLINCALVLLRFM